MELRAYLRILASKWWIVLLTFLITYTMTLALTFIQKPLYQARATFVVTLGSPFRSDKDFASAVDILSRRTEIGTTYATVMNSRRIRRLAGDRLNLSEEQRADVAVSSRLLPGTNVLEITTQAHDPVLARDFTNAVGAVTVAYTRGLYETYNLEPLDQANLPDTPIRPNKPLNLVLGALIGLVLGCSLAFLAAYLQAPTDQVANFAIMDSETGVYNRRYFELRLRQEVSRAKRTGDPLAIALLEIDRHAVLTTAPSSIRSEALRKAAMLLTPALREEDILAHWDGTVFAVLLPDRPEGQVRSTIASLQASLAATPLDLDAGGVRVNLQGVAGLALYSDGDMTSEDLVDRARQALVEAARAANATVYPLPALAIPRKPPVVAARKYDDGA